MEITIESKLNTYSLEELESMTPDSYGVIVNKLLNENVKRNIRVEREIEKLAGNIALIETFRRLNHKQNVRGIYFNTNKQVWVANRIINGKLKHIKSGKDKLKVQSAYEDFCIVNNLQF